jgi:hypothetical protein
MIGKRTIYLVCICAALTLCTCIDPFYPKLDKYQSLLVVDGLLTDENASYYVKLSQTTETQGEAPLKVTGAMVSIRDDLGNNAILEEVSEGLYKSDSLTFTGTVDRIYTLYIRTDEGKEYESEPCKLSEGTDIDTVTYARDKVTLDDGEIEEGLRIYIDSKDPKENKYFRWDYEEWWKFNIPYPVDYVYIDQSNIFQIPRVNVTCWNNRRSDEIIIQAGETENFGAITDRPILFIPSTKSDRLSVQYCIQIRQFSISEKEYEFWDQLQQLNEAGGDIFDKQPFPVISNIHSSDDPGEQVLGYFQVSGVKLKKIYITRREVQQLELHPYRYGCELLFAGPWLFPMAETPVTFIWVYNYLVSQGYAFIGPTYFFPGELESLMFTQKRCADCTVTGTPSKPDFWIDLN